jgi:Family of unknown function (DUF6220)
MVRYMRWIYVGWLGLTAAAIVLQFYLAGYAVFGFTGLNGFETHLVLGGLIVLASVIGIALAFAARVPWRITGINGAFFVLMVVQGMLAHVPVRALSALHVVNGMVVFAVSLYMLRESIHWARQQGLKARGQRRIEAAPQSDRLTGSAAAPPQ